MADAILIEVGDDNDIVQVIKHDTGTYSVTRKGVVRHPHGSAEDAMRALSVYLHDALYKLDKLTPKPYE